MILILEDTVQIYKIKPPTDLSLLVAFNIMLYFLIFLIGTVPQLKKNDCVSRLTAYMWNVCVLLFFSYMLHPLFSPFLFKNTIKNKLITMLMNSCTRMECRDIVAVAAHTRLQYYIA